MYIDLIVMRRAIKFDLFFFFCKMQGNRQQAFQTDIMEIRYNCAKRYHVLYINCAKGTGIIFELVTVLNVIIFLLICHLFSSITRLIKGN